MEVYVDNASTTKPCQEVLDIITECNSYYGNPHSIHAMGQDSKKLIEISRKQIADSIGAKPNEIIFTSSGTESDNLAIQGFAEAYNQYGNHIITTQIEHKSVLNTVKELEYRGYRITYLPVDDEGKINLNQLQRAIRRDTILISIMFANNEIGTIQPIKEIGEIAKQYNIAFHTDAVQAFGHCDINVNDCNIDMLSLSGHKIYAPKGIGALYVKQDIALYPLIFGGGQEYGLRNGTENVQGIVGMGKAVELLSQSERTENTERVSKLKIRFVHEVMEKIPDVKLNGSMENGLPGIANLSFTGVDGNTLVKLLSEKGIYVSNGDIYSNASKPSHVLRAIGLSDSLAHGSLRFSFGKYNTDEDVNYILDILPGLVAKLRNN
ncbi:cysteine desulfurylase family member [Holotrichia oblita]|nr:cysteine desulfurylase family member [Holotrichia oblita]